MLQIIDGLDQGIEGTGESALVALCNFDYRQPNILLDGHMRIGDGIGADSAWAKNAVMAIHAYLLQVYMMPDEELANYLNFFNCEYLLLQSGVDSVARFRFAIELFHDNYLQFTTKAFPLTPWQLVAQACTLVNCLDGAYSEFNVNPAIRIDFKKLFQRRSLQAKMPSLEDANIQKGIAFAQALNQFLEMANQGNFISIPELQYVWDEIWEFSSLGVYLPSSDDIVRRYHMGLINI